MVICSIVQWLFGHIIRSKLFVFNDLPVFILLFVNFLLLILLEADAVIKLQLFISQVIVVIILN